jgi:hypothetical protein
MSSQICGFALNHTLNQTLEAQYIGIFPNLSALEHDKILNLSPNKIFNCTIKKKEKKDATHIIENINNITTWKLKIIIIYLKKKKTKQSF